jgi:hypothetical protein
MAGSSGAIRAGRAFVEIFTDSSAMARGLKAASRKLAAWGASVRNLGLKFSAAGAAIVTPLVDSARRWAEAGAEMAHMSERTGVSVEALSALGYVAERSGSSLEAVEVGLKRMQRLLAEAALGSQTAREALATLGLTMDDLNGLRPEEQFKLIADRLSRVENPAVRAAAAIAIFGRSGTQLLPMMTGGAAGIERLTAHAEKLGLIMSGESAEAARRFEDTLHDLWRVLKKCYNTIGAAVAPALSGLAKWLTRVIVSVTKWIREHQGLVKVALIVGGVLAGLGAAFVMLGTVISAVGTVIGALGTIASAVGTVLGILGSIIGAICTPVGAVIAAIVALGGIILWVTGAGGKALDWLGGVFGDLKDDTLTAFEGISDALAAGDIGLAARILWLTLKMEWEKGCKALLSIWLNFRNFFIRLAWDAWYGALKGAEWVWHGLEIGWIETTAFLSNVWTRFCQGINKAWNWAGVQISKGINWVKSLWDDSFDADSANRGADAWLESENRKIDAEANAAVDARQRQREAERNREDALHQKVLDQFQAEHDAKEKGLNDEYDARMKQSQDELDAARKEWQEAIAAAKAKRQAGEDEDKSLDLPRGPDDYDFEGIGQAVAEVRKNMFAAQGTFNAAAIPGMGIGGVAERTAKATEATAKNTEKLLEHAKLGGLEFE